WSSDVCSSDLDLEDIVQRLRASGYVYRLDVRFTLGRRFRQTAPPHAVELAPSSLPIKADVLDNQSCEPVVSLHQPDQWLHAQQPAQLAAPYVRSSTNFLHGLMQLGRRDPLRVRELDQFSPPFRERLDY